MSLTHPPYAQYHLESRHDRADLGAVQARDGYPNPETPGSVLGHRLRIFMAGMVASDPGSRWIEGSKSSAFFSSVRMRRNAGPSAGLLCRALVGHRELARRATYSTAALSVDLATYRAAAHTFARAFVFSALSTEGGPAAWRWHVKAQPGLNCNVELQPLRRTSL